jgi:hypothetical protein
MRIVSILALFILVGCAARPTTDELEAEASVTGNWTAVEDRERMNKKMRVNPELRCPENLMLFCTKDGAHEECYCMPHH